MWYQYANENKGLSAPGRLPKFDGFNSPYWIGNGMQYRPHWYEVFGAAMKNYASRNPQPTEDDSWKVDSDLYTCPSVDWRNSRNFVFGYNYQFRATPTKVPFVFVNYPVKANAITRSSETAWRPILRARPRARRPAADRSHDEEPKDSWATRSIDRSTAADGESGLRRL
jgi:hypothetical protein